MPPSSLIALIPRRRSNPCCWPSTIRASICMGWAWPMFSLTLPHLWYFKFFPSAASTFTSLFHQKQHTYLLISVCKQSEFTRAMHFCLSIDTSMTGSALSFICLGRRLVLMSVLWSPFPDTWMKFVQSCYIKNTVFYGRISVLS